MPGAPAAVALLPPLRLPPPPSLLSLEPAVPLVHGDGAIIPRQFFSEAGSLCAADTGTGVLFLSSRPLIPPLSDALSLLYHFTTPRRLSLLRATNPPAPLAPFLIVFVRLRSLLVPFPSSFRRPRFASSCSSCPSKNDGGKDAPRKGTTRARAIKKGEILERDDKRREGSPRRKRREGRFPVVGIFLGAEVAYTLAASPSLSSSAFPFAALQSTTLLLPRKGREHAT